MQTGNSKWNENLWYKNLGKMMKSIDAIQKSYFCTLNMAGKTAKRRGRNSRGDPVSGEKKEGKMGRDMEMGQFQEWQIDNPLKRGGP